MSMQRSELNSACRQLWQAITNLLQHNRDELTELEREIQYRLAAHPAVVRDEDLEIIEVVPPPEVEILPVACVGCNAEFSAEDGGIEEAGWSGWVGLASPIEIKQPTGKTRLETIGICPNCRSKYPKTIAETKVTT